jgi:hypothetical protein
LWVIRHLNVIVQSSQIAVVTIESLWSSIVSTKWHFLH